MFFGPKVACEQCNTKVKESKSTYRRGSRFCGDACIATWEAENPPPIARGDEAKMRQELAMLLDEALAESQRRYDPTFGVRVGGVEVHVGSPHGAAPSVGSNHGMLAGIDARHRAEAMQTAAGLFQSHVLRAAPLLRALGFIAEATMIDSNDFQSGVSAQLVPALKAARQRMG